MKKKQSPGNSDSNSCFWLMALWPFGVIYEWIERKAHLEARAHQEE